MKRIKINLAIFAVILATGAAFAFKAPSTVKHKTADVWYQFNGGSQSSPSNYTKLAGDPACNGSGALCAIQGPDNGTHPTQATVNTPDDTRLKP